MAALSLTITIPDTKVAVAKAAFLKRRPKPTDSEHPDFGLSDKAWIEKVISSMVNREIQLGKRELDAPAPDSTDYFTE